MTHRQFLSWNIWLEMQWNHPSRSDHYAMQIAAQFGDAKPIKFNLPHETVKKTVATQDWPEDFWVPKRMSKEDVVKANQAARMAQLTRKHGKRN